MVERPIIFSAPMVRAILAGRKTQTRRIIPAGNVLDDISSEAAEDLELRGWETFRRTDDALFAAKLRYAAGDLLWVRETWAPVNDDGDRWIDYRATPRFPGESDRRAAAWDNALHEAEAIRWRPSIHMPRWASRITLKVTGVKVERLRDISEADAKAEGIYWSERFEGWTSGAGADESCDFHTRLPERSFEKLWERIHGDGSWDANPWVAAISFERVPPSHTGQTHATPPDGDGG